MIILVVLRIWLTQNHVKFRYFNVIKTNKNLSKRLSSMNIIVHYYAIMTRNNIAILSNEMKQFKLQKIMQFIKNCRQYFQYFFKYVALTCLFFKIKISQKFLNSFVFKINTFFHSNRVFSIINNETNLIDDINQIDTTNVIVDDESKNQKSNEFQDLFVEFLVSRNVIKKIKTYRVFITRFNIYVELHYKKILIKYVIINNVMIWINENKHKYVLEFFWLSLYLIFLKCSKIESFISIFAMLRKRFSRKKIFIKHFFFFDVYDLKKMNFIKQIYSIRDKCLIFFENLLLSFELNDKKNEFFIIHENNQHEKLMTLSCFARKFVLQNSNWFLWSRKLNILNFFIQMFFSIYTIDYQLTNVVYNYTKIQWYERMSFTNTLIFLKFFFVFLSNFDYFIFYCVLIKIIFNLINIWLKYTIFHNIE